MLLDFSADTYGRAAATPARSPLPALLETAVGNVGRVQLPAAAADLLDRPEDWSWQQLRDYVLRSAAERHGPQPVDDIKVNSIFKSFHTRWGKLAGPIARFTFEQQDGYWRSAPVTPTRFCKASDAYFAHPISERLNSAAAA